MVDRPCPSHPFCLVVLSVLSLWPTLLSTSHHELPSVPQLSRQNSWSLPDVLLVGVSSPSSKTQQVRFVLSPIIVESASCCIICILLFLSMSRNCAFQILLAPCGAEHRTLFVILEQNDRRAEGPGE